MEELWEDLLDNAAFSLFAIHSSLEDHALAYAINHTCRLRLRRTEKDHELDRKSGFVVFSWNDRQRYREWTLFRNPGWEAATIPSGGLFAAEPARNRRYLIHEKKEVDYFIKLEGEAQGVGIMPDLLSIRGVATAYRLQATDLKSRHNLILY